MESDDAMKKILTLVIVNYSHVIDPAAFLRETEIVMRIVYALTDRDLSELWEMWEKALEAYSAAGWKDCWKRCAMIMAELFRIIKEDDLIHVVPQILNIDRIQFRRLEEVEE
ncbi:MAG: hypothetical protein RMH75_07235 [Archaeoglobaceae archaeon]|nr:hypothetical protein [Archaeoglobaceae archaeon]